MSGRKLFLTWSIEGLVTGYWALIFCTDESYRYKAQAVDRLQRLLQLWVATYYRCDPATPGK